MKKIGIALSGGVDSTVAAYLLKKQNIPIIGISFITGFENNLNIHELRRNIMNISNILNINTKIINIKEYFIINVVNYFIKTYFNGKTPNPCLVCNPKIKLGILVSIAKKIGANKIATGHYAKIIKTINKTCYIAKGKDKTKDQSYFLSRLKLKELNIVTLPIGNMKKKQVKFIALKNKLQSNNTKSSQDVCFIKNKKYIKFIENNIEKIPKPGNIIDINGRYLGYHKGIHRFTIGQRNGINYSNIKTYYVIKIDPYNNSIIIGEKKLLYSQKCKIEKIIWITKKYQKNMYLKMKIRYKHKPSSATLLFTNKKSATITFNASQLAITPGQGAALYINNKILGSGWIK